MPPADVTRGEVTATRRITGTGDVVEEPAGLGPGEVGVEHQPGLVSEQGFVPVLFQRCTEVGGATILPDQGPVDRLACRSIPEEAGLPLVGDADRPDAIGGHAGLGKRALDRRTDRGPDLLHIMLHLAGAVTTRTFS